MAMPQSNNSSVSVFASSAKKSSTNSHEIGRSLLVPFSVISWIAFLFSVGYKPRATSEAAEGQNYLENRISRLEKTFTCFRFDVILSSGNHLTALKLQ